MTGMYLASSASDVPSTLGGGVSAWNLDNSYNASYTHNIPKK